MADLDPKDDVLDKLLMLMDYEILKNEKDWGAIKALDKIEHYHDGDENSESQDSHDGGKK